MTATTRTRRLAGRGVEVRSRAAAAVMEALRFRASLGQTWAVPEPRGRAALVVPTLMAGAPLQRLCGVDLTTLSGLAGAGLITVTERNQRPRYGYARPTAPGSHCWHITLTPEGERS